MISWIKRFVFQKIYIYLCTLRRNYSLSANFFWSWFLGTVWTSLKIVDSVIALFAGPFTTADFGLICFEDLLVLRIIGWDWFAPWAEAVVVDVLFVSFCDIDCIWWVPEVEWTLPLGGKELLFEREWVDVDRVAKNSSTSN